MTRFQALPFYVFDHLNTLRARGATAEDALHILASLDDGAYVAVYSFKAPTMTVFKKGSEQFPMSMTDAISLMNARAKNARQRLNPS